MEKILLRRNRHHFRQTEDTPLAGQEVIETIGLGTASKHADQIINGTADLKTITIDPMSIQLLRLFRTNKSEIKIEVTKKKMMD